MQRTNLFPLTLVAVLCAASSMTAEGQGLSSEHNAGDETGTPHYRKTNMHLCPEGKWALGEDDWGKIVRVNMLKITAADWAQVPGVKKAWPMKGFEGVEGMAFHPVLSEVKDVDRDGKPDIFRCRSEHPGARIERLRYDDGSVVWESEPLGAMFGDETRLPVFDLHGNGSLSVLYASRHDDCGKLWCFSADTGETRWCASYGDGAIKNHGNGQGDVVVGHFLNRRTQAVVVRDGGILRCYDHMGKRQWTLDTKLRGGEAYAHEIMRCDVGGDGLDEVFANWQRLTMGLRGNGTVLWEDRTQEHHSDFVDCGDVDGDGRIEVVYDHAGCDAARGPIYVVEPLTGKIKTRIDYRAQGVRHAQNIALGDFDRASKGLEIAFCEKGRNLYLFDAEGKFAWKRPVPASLLSRGDWDGDGDEEILAFGLGANVDGMFSVWDGDGRRLYAISFLPSPYNRNVDAATYKKNLGGSWRAHAMPGGHEGVRRQSDLDGNGRTDVIMPFGEWHWGSDSILFVMEGSASTSAGGTTYYFDSSGGNDAHKGTSAQSAWKSFEKLDGVELKPGDKILLKAGCRFVAPLHPKGSGTEGKLIVIDRYGDGADPVVAGQGKVENAIRLHNQHHWEIRNLTITNTDGGGWDDQRRSVRRAIYVTAEDAGDVEHIYLQNLEIRDVRGMYRFADHQTNGGIICQVTGKSKKTRFVDLRIEGCTFRTNSIDRYPVVVTSSWKRDPDCEVVWKNNTLDHAGRAHIVIPADQWPRELVYYFDPEVRKVFPLEKTAAPISPFTGRVGCEDIFSEIAARLKRSWSFFEATRVSDGSWLFANRPGGKVHHIDEGARVSPTYPLAYYGELRALGFTPPWLAHNQPELRKREDAILEKWVEQLETVGLNREADWTIRNRVFMNKTKWAQPRTGESFLRSLSPGGVPPDLSTREKSLKYFNSLPWRNNPYSACGRIGHAMNLHMAKRRMAGKDPEDESYHYVKELIDKQFQHDEGYWGGQGAGFVNRTSGNMKILCTYAGFDWEIPAPKKIIDYHLSGATEEAGFEGSGCSAFNQMHPLAAISRQYPELSSYRGEEIDKYTAMTFLTFLKNWDEKTNFYGQDWLGKHNNGVPLFMPHLMLDIPLMRVSTVYNWREGPIITRGEDGTIRRNKVIYQTKDFPFGG